MFSYNFMLFYLNKHSVVVVIVIVSPLSHLDAVW